MHSVISNTTNASEEMEVDNTSSNSDEEIAASTPHICLGQRTSFQIESPSLPPLNAAVFNITWKVSKPSDGNMKLNFFGSRSNSSTHKQGDDNANSAPSTTKDKLMFKDCGGLEKQINFIRTAILDPLTRGESSQYERFGLEPPKGILFYGVPGTGKTRLAQALSNEISEIIKKPVHFIYRKGNDIASKYFGESSSNLRQVFEEAERQKPSVLFFDELDGLCPTRDKPFLSEAYVTIVTTMLGLMDELQNGHVFVIGATNRLDDIDPALRRPGRFDKYLEFLPPTQQGRQEILTIHTNQWKSKPSAELITKLSQETSGFSGADLAKLCLDAFDQALSRKITSENELKHIFTFANVNLDEFSVTEADWNLALSRSKPSATGTFGSVQYISHNKEATADYVQPLVYGNMKALKEMIAAMLPKQATISGNNNSLEGIVQALYIWSDFESSLSNLDDFIIAPLFGAYGGEEMTNWAKYSLSSETLYSTHPSLWSKKINDTFSQAISSHLPSILYIPGINELCDSITSHHLTEAINLKHQLERLRDTHVLLVATGTTSPDFFMWNNPFKNVFSSESRVFKILRPSEAERKAFFSGIFQDSQLNKMSNEDKLVLNKIHEHLVKITEDQDIGSIVALFDSVQFNLLTRESTHDMLQSIFTLVASYQMNRALISASNDENNYMDAEDEL